MGTKVQNLLGYYSMRDLNEESSSCGWPLLYGDKSVTNGQYYSNYLPSTTADACLFYDKDCLKRKMLEHEAVFKNQVFELHRLYRIQRDLMDEARRKELHRNQMPFETSFSTGPLASQITSIDGQKWHMGGFPMENSACARPSTSNIEGTHSPLGSLKENGKQASLFPSPYGDSSNDVEVLEARPSKVRRKMFDLQLPAEEYIDTEENEKPSDEKINGTTIYLPDRNCNLEKERDVEPFYGDGGKAGSQENSSKCEQSLRSKNGLADLNEPVQVDETNVSPYVSILSHNPSQMATDSSDLHSKPRTRLFGLSKEDLLKSHHATDSQAQNNGYMENNGSEIGWNSMLLEAGQAKSNLKSIPQVLEQEKPISSSQTMQDALMKAHEPSSDYITNQSKADLRREKTVCDLEMSERSNEISINKQPESVVSLYGPNLFAVSPKSWSHSASSWEMTNSSLSQKSASVQMPPFLNASSAVSRSTQSGQSNGIFGGSWSLNINSKSNPGVCCEVPVQNGYYHASSSGSKELSVSISSTSYDYLNHKNECKGVPECFMNQASVKYYNGLNCNDKKPGKDVNLNERYSNGSSNNLVPRQSGLEIMDGEQKQEDHLSLLAWLRARSACKNETQNAGKCISITSGELSFFQPSKSDKDESLKGSGGNFMYDASLIPCSKDTEPKVEVGDSSCKEKILGVPIFEKPCISPKKNQSSLTPPTVSTPNSSDGAVEDTHRNQLLDINVPCDPEVLELDQQTATEAIDSKKELSTTEGSSRNQIDLNLIMSEDEASMTPIPSTIVRMKAEIDLEAPAAPEVEEDVIPAEKQLVAPQVSVPSPQERAEQSQDELMTNAAEAIVAISSLLCSQVDDVICGPSESPVVDPLSWFVDVVSSCTDDLGGKFETARGNNCQHNEESSSESLDYFEAMTLNLTEAKEEDYMPKPLVPESIRIEETGTTLFRARKGPARRGRQRRDFQRDILPGLSSLSRHEVTEDLQTFGGLMRATGHSWSGLTRRTSSRNGSGRGRRRVQVTLSPPPPPPPPSPPVATNETCTQMIQQLSKIEVGLEDRSLAGWGKTTRRPRRQRYPAGNSSAIPLT